MRGLEWWFPFVGALQSLECSWQEQYGNCRGCGLLPWPSAASNDAVAEFIEKSAADEATMAGLEFTVCSRKNVPEVHLSALELGATWLPWVISPLHWRS